MSKYFKNFTEEIGEVYVKLCSDNAAKEQFSSHGKIFRHPSRGTFMINYYGVMHKASFIGDRSFLFSHKRKEYYAQLEDC